MPFRPHEAVPESVNPGDLLRLRTWRGPSQAAAGLVLTEFRGSPLQQILLLGSLDSNGEWSVGGNVPANMASLEFELTTWALDPTRGVLASCPVSVQVQ